MTHSGWVRGTRLAGAVVGWGVALAVVGSSSAFAANPPPPPSPASAFELTGFTAQPGGQAETYTLTVTVTQTHFDGSDPVQNGVEFHAFPTTIYVCGVVTGHSGCPMGPWRALLNTAGQPGISYPRGGTHDVSASAAYTLTLPSGTTLDNNDSIEIYPPAANSEAPGARYTFRMGPSTDPSWPDDVVSGSSALAIPYGELPEVPWAAGLPLLGLAGATTAWMLRRRRPAVHAQAG